MGKLNDRVALVTGGQRGLGAAILKEMAAEGATCIVNYPSASEQEEADALVGELGGMGVFAAAMAADISDTEAANSLIAGIQKRFGRLDILVNNAGVVRLQTWEEIERETWDRTISVNLTGVFNCCKAALGVMRNQKKGTLSISRRFPPSLDEATPTILLARALFSA